jgi:hypothetical protein
MWKKKEVKAAEAMGMHFHEIANRRQPVQIYASTRSPGSSSTVKLNSRGFT